MDDLFEVKFPLSNNILKENRKEYQTSPENNEIAQANYGNLTGLYTKYKQIKILEKNLVFFSDKLQQ